MSNFGRMSGKKPKRSEQRKWIDKLDKVFSLYIRMRDSREFQYKAFRCISCGRYLPIDKADNGHYVSRANMSLRFDQRNCNAECSFCLTPDALILKHNLKWVPLGELKEGDRLFAFSKESVGRSDQRKHWEESVVTHLHRDFQEVFDVELENGDHVKTTAEHKWIVHDRKGCRWLATKDMWINGQNMYGKKKTGPHTKNVTTIVCKPIKVVTQDFSYDMHVRPHKISKLNINKLGMVCGKYDTKVKSITPIGKKEIVVMETSTHTFIANGYMMHNCNRMSSDHLIGYRKNLVVKLGMSAFKKAHPGMSPIMEVVKSLGEREVELLEAEKYQTRKWSVFELQETYKYYAALVLKMKDEM